MSRHGLLPFRVIHARLAPKRYSFTHNFFWFKINLDDVQNYPSSFVSYNKFGLYSFYDSDHLKLGEITARGNYIKFAKMSGLETEIVNVTIFTQLRFLGYVFNPVSFILLKDAHGLEHAIIEIGNTFNEIKPYFVHHSKFTNGGFQFKTKKYFYISPFIEHDNDLDFRFQAKGDEISISIDDLKGEQKVLFVNFQGRNIPATTSNLLKCTMLSPFVTLQIIFLIHFHAMVLIMKGIKYFKKNDHLNLQKGAYKWKT